MVLGHLQRKDLIAISYVSKDFRARVEPILYRELRSTHPGVKNKQYPPIHLSLRTLSDRPELASYINCIGLCFQSPYERNFIFGSIWTEEKKLTAAEITRLASLIHNLDTCREFYWVQLFTHGRGKSFWIKCLCEGRVDIFVDVLILQSIHLRRLHLDHDYHKGRTFIGEVFRNAATGSCLRALEYAEYSNNINTPDEIRSNEDVNDNLQVRTLFSIPSMKSISMSLPRFQCSSTKFPISGLK